VHVPKPLYWLVQKLVPIACVDVLPWRQVDGRTEVCLIRRDGDGPTKNGWALVGGAVKRGEILEESVLRHLNETLEGDQLDWRVDEIDLEHPLHAAQYSPWGLRGHRPDSRKHAIALTFLVRLRSGKVRRARGEADHFDWITVDRIPDEHEFVFDHGSIVATLLPSVVLAAQRKPAGTKALTLGPAERR